MPQMPTRLITLAGRPVDVPPDCFVAMVDGETRVVTLEEWERYLERVSERKDVEDGKIIR